MLDTLTYPRVSACLVITLPTERVGGQVRHSTLTKVRESIPKLEDAPLLKNGKETYDVSLPTSGKSLPDGVKCCLLLELMAAPVNVFMKICVPSR